ncbi:MAG: hypothetical protein IJ035_02895 [Oscillospiraceae bacterium]|nr:hypothetical protein [Oscillospiraceae bacterium]
MSGKYDYEEKLNEEIENRICEMESDEYDFPERFGRRDYIALGIVAFVSLLMLIIGAYI